MLKIVQNIVVKFQKVNQSLYFKKKKHISRWLFLTIPVSLQARVCSLKVPEHILFRKFQKATIVDHLEPSTLKVQWVELFKWMAFPGKTFSGGKRRKKLKDYKLNDCKVSRNLSCLYFSPVPFLIMLKIYLSEKFQNVNKQTFTQLF